MTLGAFRRKSNLFLISGTALLAAALSFVDCSGAAAAVGVRAGTLTCNVASGWGFVLGSSRKLHCSFTPNEHKVEHYTGVINKFGVDIGYTGGGVLVWGVLAPSAQMNSGALAGTYAGAVANATVGVGVGANALIGGGDHSVALQPLSIEGNKGLNVAGGIGSITLKPAP